MPPASSSSVESLLSHASFLRSLARELTRDASHADDLVQRTWVAALENPPGDEKPLRRWLAAILRNFAREEHRTETSRAHRETLAARPVAVGGPDELGQLIAMQHALLRAVSELAEPYRSVIHKRYYEDLAPREIAARSGVPLKTVKTQLHRGLALLRARLDREHGGDRSAWLLALIPLTGRPSWTVHALGALLLDAKLKVALACVALIAAAGGIMFVSSRMETPIAAGTTPVIAAAENSRAVEEPKESTLTPLASEERHSIESAAPAASETTLVASPTEPRIIRGRVIDLEHRPVGGIELVEYGQFLPRGGKLSASDMPARPVSPVIATSASDGTFELPAPKSVLGLRAQSPAFVTVLGVRLAQNYSAAGPIVAVAPRQPLAGVVLDPEGKPVANARVEIVLPKGLRAGMGEILDSSFLMAWNTSTDERGHFELTDAPGCAGELSASSPAFEKSSIPLPSQTSYDLVLRLGPTSNPHLVVRGIVVDQQGAPVDQAYVALGNRTVLSAADGSFELEADIDPTAMSYVNDQGTWRPEEDLGSVRAVKVGHLPAIHRLPELEELRAHPVLDPIRLVLGGEPLSIEGRVEDVDGVPIAGVAVWPLDGTSFGRIIQKTGLEGVSRPSSMEAMMRGGPLVEKARTDADGRFVLDGLCDREYEIAAFDAPTLRVARVENVLAGRHGVVIKLRARRDLVRVGGRVVTESGAPVEGVRVFALAPISGDGTLLTGPDMTTDAEGRFGFLGEASSGLQFSCAGETIVPMMSFRPPPKQRLDEFEIVVWLRCHLRIALVNKAAASSFKALDADGKPMKVMFLTGPMMRFGEFGQITEGKSETAVVRDSCKTIVFYDSGHEVGRVSVELKPGELNVVTW